MNGWWIDDSPGCILLGVGILTIAMLVVGLFMVAVTA